MERQQRVDLAEGKCRRRNGPASRGRRRTMQLHGPQGIVSLKQMLSEVEMNKVVPVVLAAAPLFVMLTAMIAG
jgi:hypothetical protein